MDAFDICSTVAEQVKSVGGDFIAINLEEITEAEGCYAKQVSGDTRELICQGLSAYIAKADVVNTTAKVPGKAAPLLIAEDTVA